MVGPAVGQPVDKPRITVVGEDNRLVASEQFVEAFIGQSMRVLAFGLKRHEVDNVDHANP
ncbi:hypothetical protein D3C83_91650 [compost metagenome]